MEDLLDEGLLLFSKLVSDFFLSSIIFLCILPTNLVGVGAGRRLSRERIFSSGARGLGVGVFSSLVALVTYTSGNLLSLLSLLTMGSARGRGFSVKEGPGDPTLERPSSKMLDLRLDLLLRSATVSEDQSQVAAAGSSHLSGSFLTAAVPLRALSGSGWICDAIFTWFVLC